MNTFEVGERVVHDWGNGELTYGVILAIRYNNDIYLLPENTDVFGLPDHKVNGQGCYLLTKKYFKKIGPALTPQERVLARIKSLEARFTSKTLPKTKMKPLALPH